MMIEPVEIPVSERHKLIPLFESCPYDRVLIESVLEGRFGWAYADSAAEPTVARLNSGAWTMLAGDPCAPGVKDLLRLAPVAYVTPQTAAWRQTLQEAFGKQFIALPFVDFSTKELDLAHLEKLIETLPAGFELKRLDRELAEQLPADTGNAYFFENFHTIADFLQRGLGYAVLQQGKIVSAATSMAQCQRAIDIEIETVAGYQKRGLATVGAARLVAHCLERGIEPCWLAANLASERLALKLGYVRGERYETLAIGN
jgi:hypothetical protein